MKKENMRRIRNTFAVRSLVAAGILIGFTALSQAQLTQMLYAPPASPSWRDNYTGGSGCKFETGSSNVIVSHLGFFSTNNITGLQTNHFVGVYGTTSGTPILGQVVVPAGMSAYYTNNFYWMPLNPPLLLASNTSYYVAAMPYNGDGDYWGDSFTATYNTWFVGSQAVSTRATAYGPGNSTWPVTGFSTFGSGTTYCVEGMGYIQEGPALVGIQHTNVAISAGQTLNVVGFASGQVPIAYQWYLASGVPVSGQTNATLVISNAVTTNSGAYYLTASNTLGGAQSSNVVVSVTAIPVSISQQPTNTTVFQNYPVTFSITATGTPPISYQWFSNGVAISGATASTYSFVASLANNGELVSCQASNNILAVSYTTNSSNATLTVIPNLAQPQGFLHGFNNKLDNNTYGGQQGGQFVTGNSLVLVTHLGYYAWPANTVTNGTNIICNLTNSAHYVGLYSGNGAELLGFVQIPQGTNAVINGYMWQPLDPPLVLSNNTQYLLDAQTTTGGDPWGDTYVIPDLNSYFAVSCDAVYGGNGWGATPYVGGAYPGQMYSAPNMAILALSTPAAYVLPEMGITTNAGFSETLTAIVDGQAPLDVQWYEEPGVLLAGQTNLTLTFSAVAVSNTGSYYVIATNPVTQASAQSEDLVLTVNADVAPYLVQDIAPSSPAIVQGSSVTFSAIFGGSPTFTYGWQLNGNPVTNNARISGANGNALTIIDVQPGDAGNYQLFATNAEGYGQSSQSALTVAPLLPFNNGIGFSTQGNTIYWLATNIVLLTQSSGSESNSTFSSGPLYVGAFQASFTYQEVIPNNTLADGATFCIQNDPRGAAALGEDGGSLGYGPTTFPGITNSVAFEIDLYVDGGAGSVGFGTNGSIGPYGATTNETPPLVLVNGDLISNFVSYDGSTLAVMMTDVSVGSTNYGATFSTNENINIPSVLGTNVAYVGFTGADGASVSAQEIGNFSFVSLPRLSAQAAGANLVLSWPAAVGDFVLEQSPVLGSSATWQPVANAPALVNGQNEVTVPVAGATSFYELVVTNVPNL
jgi:hypothetical protein